MALNVGNRRGVLDGFLEFLGRTEGDLLAGLDVDRFAGGGVAAHAGGTLADLEDAEADDADALALLQVLGDHGDHVAENGFRLLLRQFLILGDRRCQVLQRNGGWGRCFLRHIWPSSLLMPWERFRAEWVPVRARNPRQMEAWCPGSDAIRTEQTPGNQDVS